MFLYKRAAASAVEAQRYSKNTPKVLKKYSASTPRGCLRPNRKSRHDLEKVTLGIDVGVHAGVLSNKADDPNVHIENSENVIMHTPLQRTTFRNLIMRTSPPTIASEDVPWGALAVEIG